MEPQNQSDGNEQMLPPLNFSGTSTSETQSGNIQELPAAPGSSQKPVSSTPVEFSQNQNLQNPLNKSQPVQTASSAPSTSFSAQPGQFKPVGGKDYVKQQREHYVTEVMRAIEQTKDDPFRQAQLIEHSKRSYLREVCNYNVKASENDL